jgi:hypothetical protein
MAVADVFDALIAERVYKKGFPYEKAMAIITEGAGKHFDPVIVEAFTHISKALYDARTKLAPDDGTAENAENAPGAAVAEKATENAAGNTGNAAENAGNAAPGKTAPDGAKTA